jgi:hypothetical protein
MSAKVASLGDEGRNELEGRKVLGPRAVAPDEEGVSTPSRPPLARLLQSKNIRPSISNTAKTPQGTPLLDRVDGARTTGEGSSVWYGRVAGVVTAGARAAAGCAITGGGLAAGIPGSDKSTGATVVAKFCGDGMPGKERRSASRRVASEIVSNSSLEGLPPTFRPCSISKALIAEVVCGPAIPSIVPMP